MAVAGNNGNLGGLQGPTDVPGFWITTRDGLSSDNLTAGNGTNGTNATSGGGPEALPVGEQAVLITFYTLSTLAAVTGNTLVIIVFTWGRRKTDLRPFLINLAIADLIMAVFCMPFSFTQSMLGHWIFSPPMCPIVLFFQLVSVTASVSTNMAIGIDRFWVVTFPLKSRVTAKRYRIVIAIIWVIAILLSSVQLAIGRAVPIGEINNVVYYACKEDWFHPKEIWRRGYTCFILASTYIVPLIILSLTYGFVGKKLWQRTAPGNKDASRDAQQLKSKRKVVKMLVIVVALFGICWMPLHVFMLVVDYSTVTNTATPLTMRILTAIYYAAHWLAMANSFVNPIIYGFLNDSFKADLFYLWRMWFPCCRCCPCVRQPALSRMMTSASQYRGYTRYTRQDSSSGSGSVKNDSGKKMLTVKMNGRGRTEHSATEMDARNSLLNAEEPNGKHAIV